MYATPQPFLRIAGKLLVAAFVSTAMFVTPLMAGQSGGSSGATTTAQSCPDGKVWSKKLKKCIAKPA